jgi:hypothetical protein
MRFLCLPRHNHINQFGLSKQGHAQVAATNLKQRRMYNLTIYCASSFIDSINLTNGSNLRNQVVSSLVWLWWVTDLVRFEFESGIVSFYLSFNFVSFRESCLLVSWCAGDRCGMACSDEDRGRSRRPSAEDRGSSHRSGTQWPGDREVGWRCVWSASCTWRRGA